MSVKESLVDKWNRFAKKSICLNGSIEISCGRLVFVTVITGVQILSMLLSGAQMPTLWFLFSNYIFSLKQPVEKNE